MPLLPLLEVLLLGTAAGVIGALATLHRKVFFAEAMTHATFPGAVLGVVCAFAWWPGLAASQASTMLFIGALVMCAPMAALMKNLATLPGISPQSAAGIVLTFGFALGYFLAKWFQPLPIRVDTFLTGSVLTVGRVDVGAAATLLILTVIVGGAMWPMVYRAFDPHAPLRHGRLIDASVLCLISGAIVVSLPAVGSILPIALLAAPAASVRTWSRSPLQFFGLSALLGAIVGVVGLLLGVTLGLSAGGMIAVVGGACYLASSAARLLLGHARV